MSIISDHMQNFHGGQPSKECPACVRLTVAMTTSDPLVRNSQFRDDVGHINEDDVRERHSISSDPVDGPWYYQENEHHWQLFHGERQIIKAAKHDTRYTEYWPTPEDSEAIVNALNAAPRDISTVTGSTGHVRADLVRASVTGSDRSSKCSEEHNLTHALYADDCACCTAMIAREHAAIQREARAGFADDLQKARDLVDEWAAYAPDYFKEKWNLVGDLAALDAKIKALRNE